MTRLTLKTVTTEAKLLLIGIPETAVDFNNVAADDP